MKASLIISISLVLSTLLMACYAQSTGQYQAVGGDYGKTWLNNFNAQNPAPVEDSNKSGLWSWGGAPKGRSIINGQLMTDPYYYWKSLNLSYGWLGQAYVDNKTGYPVYAFIDPYTGNPDYFYMDPKTGNPVYVNPDSSSGAASGVTGTNVPPWVSNPSNYPNNYPSDSPWLGMPYGDNTGNVYGNPNTGTSSYYGYNNGGGYGDSGLGMA